MSVRVHRLPRFDLSSIKMPASYITFTDGNVIVSTSSHDFCVHRGLLCISSAVWQRTLGSVGAGDNRRVQVHVPLEVSDVDIYMQALYGM